MKFQMIIKPLRALMLAAIGVTALSSWAGPAMMGGANGGGGKGAVCRNADGSVRVVYLLDLWEAEHVWRNKVERTEEPVSRQVDRALKNLAHAADWKGQLQTLDSRTLTGPELFYEKMQYEVPRFFRDRSRASDINWMTNAKLELTPDSFERAVPRDCPVEQIVRYEDDVNQILIDQDLFDKMPATDQAGLIVHEVLYKFLREESGGESNSLRVRRAVGLAFSGYKFSSPKENAPSSRSITCEDFKGMDEVQLFVTDPAKPDCLAAAASYIAGKPVLGFAPDMQYGACRYSGGFTLEGVGAAGAAFLEKSEEGMLAKLLDRAKQKFESQRSGSVVPTYSYPHEFEIDPSAVRTFNSDGKAVKYKLRVWVGAHPQFKGGVTGVNAMIIDRNNQPVTGNTLVCHSN